MEQPFDWIEDLKNPASGIRNAPEHWLVSGLAAIRQQRGLSAEDLALKSNLEVWQIEQAERSDSPIGLRWEDIQELSRVLYVTPQDLFGQEQTPWWPGLSQVEWLERVALWDRQKTKVQKGRVKGGQRSRRPPDRKPRGWPDVTEPRFPAEVFLDGTLPRVNLGWTQYRFDGISWRPMRGRVQAGGAVTIFGLTECRLDVGLSEQALADAVEMRWVRLRSLLRHEAFPTMEEWLAIWEALGRPIEERLMWGSYPVLVSLRQWPGLQKKVQQRQPELVDSGEASSG